MYFDPQLSLTSRGWRLLLSWLLIAVASSATDHTAASETPVSIVNQLGQRGFVFVDGRFLTPPYQITFDGQAFAINDVLLTAEDLDLRDYQAELQAMQQHQQRRALRLAMQQRDWDSWTTPDLGQRENSRSDWSPLRLFHETAIPQLSENDVMVIHRGEKPVFFEETREAQDLLSLLLQIDAPQNQPIAAPLSLSIADQRAWDQLVATFEPSPEFRIWAMNHLSKIQRVQEVNERTISAVIWGHRIAVPLTLFAMIVVFYGFGHLMSHRPLSARDDRSRDQDAGSTTDETRMVVSKSLLIVGVLATVDLVWTVVAAQVGATSEFQPLGSQWIDQPVLLIACKSLVVTVAITVLYCLRQLPAAQKAAWWSCLVLTLFVARELTFHSMLM